MIDARSSNSPPRGAPGLEVEEERTYFITDYFSFFFPAYFVWHIWILLFYLIAGDQAQSFCMALRKTAPAARSASPLGPQLHEGDLRNSFTHIRFVRSGSHFLAHGEPEVHKLPRLVESSTVAVEGVKDGQGESLAGLAGGAVGEGPATEGDDVRTGGVAVEDLEQGEEKVVAGSRTRCARRS